MDPPQGSLDEPRKPAWIERIASYRRDQITTAHCATSEILPSFFIVGPPRTGTTWLHEILLEQAGLSRIRRPTWLCA